jgi:hypothetical protein
MHRCVYRRHVTRRQCAASEQGSCESMRYTGGPMRVHALFFTLCCTAGLAMEDAALAAPPTAVDRHPAARADEGAPAIRWERTLAAAKAKAQRTGKPLLVLHMFGKLTEPFC